MNFVTKYGTKQGVLVLGKQMPLGIGAAIGGVGNAAFAQFTIRSAKRAFGAPPAAWPAHVDEVVVDDVRVDDAEVGEVLVDDAAVEDSRQDTVQAGAVPQNVSAVEG